MGGCLVMDIERVVAQRLADATGFRCVLEVPDERPAEFVSVELVGSTGDRWAQVRTLTVLAWAQTRRKACEMAREVEAAVPSLVEETDIFAATATALCRWPDPDSRQERYRVTVEATVCE